MIDLVIFDMDGLMFDTEIVSYKAWKKSVEAMGYEYSKENFMDTLGKSEYDIDGLYKKMYGDDFPYEKVLELRLAQCIA